MKTSSRHIKKTAQTLLLLVITLIFCVPMNVLAYSQNDIDSIVGNTPWYDPNDCADASNDNAPLVGNDNIQKAFGYLVGKGLTPAQAAGILGNLKVESGGLLDPEIVQGGGDSLTPVSGKGYGIAQWTSAGRQQGLITLGNSDQESHKGPGDLGVQLDYLWQELSGPYKGALAALKGTTTVGDATVVILQQYEAPKDHSATGPNAQVRTKDAEDILALYGNSSATASDTTGANNDNTGCTNGVTTNVDCSVAAPTAAQATNGDMGVVRRNVVCLAQTELALWVAGKLTPSNGYFKYSQNSVQEWCADFASWIYDQAQYPLQNEPNWRVPAVQGIWDIGTKNLLFHYHAAAGYAPRPGDLVIHKNGMSHVNIVISVTGSSMVMIGGDQGHGPYPGGSSVTQYTDSKTSGIDGITGYVSPDN